MKELKEQTNLFGNSFDEEIFKMDEANRKLRNQKRRWENAFQKWSNEHGAEGNDSYGVCGYSSMCDYCDNNYIGRPCVRALNAMCRDCGLSIDYRRTNFEEIWGM